uniref:C2H2-type domain-containing protein n=1 Tax=Wuchereria bancrofti TaxID=6293 RepID=A0AAF5Q498_WUCBA
MLAANEESPAVPGILDVLRYLENEPVMLHALQEFMNTTQQRESLLNARLTEAERRLAEYEGQNAQQEVEVEEMEEEPAPQELEFNIEEAEWAPLPESDDEAEWLAEAEWAPLPEDSEESPEVPVAPVEASGVKEPEEAVREIVLRSRTIKVPVPATNTTLAAAIPEAFRPADLGDLPVQLRRELEMPQTEPYTVIRRAEGSTNIVCGICNRQFETLKGWRIHASKMHKQDGFCARCGHYLLLPPDFTAAQKSAAMELHALDWCPRACAAVMKERQVKRRRLNLVGREEDTHHLFVPVTSFGIPHAANLSLPVPTRKEEEIKMCRMQEVGVHFQLDLDNVSLP